MNDSNQKGNNTLDLNYIIQEITKKNAPQRYCFLIFGIFLSAVSFNLFFAPNNIVTGGTTGLSLIFHEYFKIEPSLFILIASAILLILSFLLLGTRMSIKSAVGTILLPIFIKATSLITNAIDLEDTSLFVLILFGGVLSGFATGIIMRTGYTTGGISIFCQIMNKYLKISIGQASLILNGIILVAGSLVFGIPNAMYAVISLYIASIITDKVLLGVSESKAFYIVTTKQSEIKQFILENLSHSVTLIKARGGYLNNRRTMLLCVIPTNEYFLVKEVISKLDPEAFFLITDAYEVSGAY